MPKNAFLFRLPPGAVFGRNLCVLFERLVGRRQRRDRRFERDGRGSGRRREHGDRRQQRDGRGGWSRERRQQRGKRRSAGAERWHRRHRRSRRGERRHRGAGGAAGRAAERAAQAARRSERGTGGTGGQRGAGGTGGGQQRGGRRLGGARERRQTGVGRRERDGGRPLHVPAELDNLSGHLGCGARQPVDGDPDGAADVGVGERARNRRLVHHPHRRRERGTPRVLLQRRRARLRHGADPGSVGRQHRGEPRLPLRRRRRLPPARLPGDAPRTSSTRPTSPTVRRPAAPSPGAARWSGISRTTTGSRWRRPPSAAAITATAPTRPTCRWPRSS